LLKSLGNDLLVSARVYAKQGLQGRGEHNFLSHVWAETILIIYGLRWQGLVLIIIE